MLELVMGRVAMVECVSCEWMEKESVLYVSVHDFEGFDADWEEVMVDYDEDSVDELEEWLEEHCVSSYGDFYSFYEFDGFVVQFGYDSMDI